MLYKLQNGRLITPPAVGVRHNGKVVSGYNNLTEEEHREDGWKNLIYDVMPENDGAIIVAYYEETETSIFQKYRVDDELVQEETEHGET